MIGRGPPKTGSLYSEHFRWIDFPVTTSSNARDKSGFWNAVGTLHDINTSLVDFFLKILLKHGRFPIKYYFVMPLTLCVFEVLPNSIISSTKQDFKKYKNLNTSGHNSRIILPSLRPESFCYLICPNVWYYFSIFDQTFRFPLR